MAAHMRNLDGADWHKGDANVIISQMLKISTLFLT